MRIVTFVAEAGPRAGLVVTRDGVDSVIDITAATDGDLPSDTVGILGSPAGLDRLRELAASDASSRRLDTVALLAPVVRPPKIIAAAMNYQAHIVDDVKQAPFDRLRTVPKLFLKPVTSVIGPDQPLHLPDWSAQVDWEVELAAIIGQGGARIPVGDALSHVAAYTIINDVSARSVDWGLAERVATHWDAFYDWLNGKWSDGFAPMGPWMVTADEVSDPQALGLLLTVNGTVFQQGSTADMLFGVAELVAFASRLMTLEPGDVIATGTPSGVGAAAGVYLRPGDVMEASISEIGVLRTPVHSQSGSTGPTPARQSQIARDQ
jgi:2-keto-4-pentenoate hydratase/2-oxohepta-3-ene-1,7-dioic acid hydratase in catechol pathway